MISTSEAVEIIIRRTVSLETETIDLSESVNRVLAEDVFADSDLPPFDRSQMDGFAVRTKDVKDAGEKNPAKLKIVGESVAGKGFDEKIKRGEAAGIMTGARVPGGADSVQKKELARELQNETGESFVEIFEATKERQNFVLKGAEIKANEKVFEAGEIISAQMIAPLASFGYGEVKVYKNPKVAVLATGSEIVEINETPQTDQIRNSNSVTLKVFAETIADVRILPIAVDEIENLKAKISRAVETCDVLIISGGVSVGDYDFTKPALRELGAEIFFERVSLRPGKPTVFAKLNGKLIFGLPGNPVSVAVTFFLFVRTALLKMQNANDCELKKGRAVLPQKIKGAKGRDSFLPAFVETNEKGKLVVESLKFGGSSNFIEFARANCLLFVPQNEILEAGEVVKILFLP
ncbi:MAG: molybdopterin molybdotransferase MoeA [Acidobacteriota bacterium]|nr:molybdopterin molybdotransferase MoeA [Acidobacteriota bacterium]